MGARNPDRIPFASYAAQAPTVGKMLHYGWQVQAKCWACGLTVKVRLRDVVALRGPDLRLWGVQSHCRDVMCLYGRMAFFGRPPGTGHFFELSRESDPARREKPIASAPEPPVNQEPDPKNKVPW